MEHSTLSWLLEVIRRAGFIIDAAQYTDDAIFAQYVLRRPESSRP